MFYFCLIRNFNIDINEVKINDPFVGGFTTNKYGNNPVPWIQFKINRKLYMKDQLNKHFPDVVSFNREAIEKLNINFRNTLISFFYNLKIRNGI